MTLFQNFKETRKLFACTTCEADFQTKDQLVTHFKQGKHDKSSFSNQLNSFNKSNQNNSSFKNQLNNFNRNKSVGKVTVASPASTGGYNNSSNDDDLQIVHSTYPKKLQAGLNDTSGTGSRSSISNAPVTTCFGSNSPSKGPQVESFKTTAESSPKTATAGTSGNTGDKSTKEDDKVLSCPECPIKFILQHLLDRHLKFVHNKIPTKSTSVISLTPDKPRDKAAEPIPNKSVDSSSNVTPSKTSVSVHETVPTSTSNPEKEVQKDDSDSNQNTPAAVVRTQGNVDSSGTKKINPFLLCPDCPVKFRVQHLLDHHMKIAHSNDQEKTTAEKDNLDSKRADTQKTTPKQVGFNIAVTNQDSNKSPEKSVKPSVQTSAVKDKIDIKRANTKKAAPKQIGFNFGQTEEPNNSTEKSFKCSLCPLEFQHKYLLVRHASTDHQTGAQALNPQPITPSKPISNQTSDKSKVFPCPECPMIFEHKFLLVRHASVAHPIAGDVTGNEMSMGLFINDVTQCSTNSDSSRDIVQRFFLKFGKLARLSFLGHI